MNSEKALIRQSQILKKQVIFHKDKSAFQLVKNGNSLKNKGKVDEAIQEYRAAIKLQPGYAKAYCMLGWAHLSKQQH
jgi:tetratricopeptide (TPR) repeat protein